MIKEDEKRFFKACVYLRCEKFSIRDIVNMYEGIIHHKRCWYLLRKWSHIGFYDYGVTLDLGWFRFDKLPERYKSLLF